MCGVKSCFQSDLAHIQALLRCSSIPKKHLSLVSLISSIEYLRAKLISLFKRQSGLVHDRTGAPSGNIEQVLNILRHTNFLRYSFCPSLSVCIVFQHLTLRLELIKELNEENLRQLIYN
jgi:hypothetical protein